MSLLEYFQNILVVYIWFGAWNGILSPNHLCLLFPTAHNTQQWLFIIINHHVLGRYSQSVWFRFWNNVFSVSQSNSSIFFLQNKPGKFQFDWEYKSEWFLFPTRFEPTWKSCCVIVCAVILYDFNRSANRLGKKPSPICILNQTGIFPLCFQGEI